MSLCLAVAGPFPGRDLGEPLFFLVFGHRSPGAHPPPNRHRVHRVAPAVPGAGRHFGVRCRGHARPAYCESNEAYRKTFSIFVRFFFVKILFSIFVKLWCEA